MRTFELAGAERRIDINALTPFIYAEEFTRPGKNGRAVPEDVLECVSRIAKSIERDDVPGILDLQKVWWAAEKSADRTVPSFYPWLESLPAEAVAVDLDGGWARPVVQEIMSGFFPGAARTDVEAEAPVLATA